MAVTSPNATLLHAALATISHEVATVDEIIPIPARLPPELLLIIRTHLHTAVTTQLFLNSTRALAEYEHDLLRNFCPDCISYNCDVFGPDIWQWQQFSSPCTCVRTTPNITRNSQQFPDPYHWLEHHLSLQAACLSAGSPKPQSSIWDVVTDVLKRHHCEPLREDSSDPVTIDCPPDGSDALYHCRVSSFKRLSPPPAVSIRPLPAALRLYETEGIGEAGIAGNAFRAEVIRRRVTRELSLAVEFQDVFSSPRNSSVPILIGPKASGLFTFGSPLLSQLRSSLVLHGAIKTIAFISTVLGVLASMPMAITTLALTAAYFYSRPVAA